MDYGKIAFRNLARQKKRTIFLAGAIAFGMIAITLLDSMTGSLTSNIAENISNIYAGHVFVNGKEKSDSGKTVNVMKDNDIFMQSIEDSGIDYRFITKRSQVSGTLYFEGKSVNQELVGADWVKDSFFTKRIMLKQESAADERKSESLNTSEKKEINGFERLKKTPNGIIISEDVADILNADVGDKLRVKLKTAQGQFNTGDFFIVGISIDPGFVGSIASFANLTTVNKLLNIGSDEYMTLGIYLHNIKSAPSAELKFRDALGTQVLIAEEKELDDENQDLFTRMMAQMQDDEEPWEGTKYTITNIDKEMADLKEIISIIEDVSFIFFLVLLFIIMVGINNTFKIVMIERTKEIGTIRALGTQRNEVRDLFLMEALFIGAIGMAVGFLISGLIMISVSSANLGVNSAISFVLKNGHFTFSLNFLKIVRNTAVVAVFTMIAALLPAMQAARKEPADALRSDK